MKFTCTKDNLLEALNLVSSIAGKQVNLPILSNVIFKVSQQKILVIATNLDIAVTATIRGKIELPGEFTIPARMAVDFVNLLSSEKVDIELLGQEVVISSGKSITKIKGMPAEDFPIIPVLEQGMKLVVDAQKLKSAFSRVLSSAARNDIRPELSGIFFGINVYGYQGLTLASTDSYRLAETQLPLIEGGEEKRTILPAKTAQEIVRIISLGASEQPTVEFLIGDNQINVRYGSAELVSRLVEGNYPDYVQIIPEHFKTTAVVSIAHLVKEIKAAGLFTTTGVNAVTVQIQPATGMLKLSSSSTQAGEYVSEVPGEITGEESTILLSHRYLLDGLQIIDTDHAVLKVINGDSPCLLVPDKGEKFRYIIMPIRQ